MKALRQLGLLKLPFLQNEPPDEDGRVLALFRNRAELKKAYGELQEEIYRLKDRVKQQEGATQRVQELLGSLEARLGVPDSAYSALAFYQLRRLWQTGRELIELFIADLSRQQEERERRQHVAEHNRRVFGQRQALERQIGDCQARAQEASDTLAALERERAGLTRFWHFFRRRSLEHRLIGARGMSIEADAALAEARSSFGAHENVSIPEFPGLSLEARRAINLTAIAFAEVLCLRLAKTRLVELAREATGRRESSDDYGSTQDCERLMAEIEDAYQRIQMQPRIARDIKLRTERLKQVAVYRNPPDTTPTADSIAPSEADVLDSDPVGARIPNVLAEDTWDLYRILLR